MRALAAFVLLLVGALMGGSEAVRADDGSVVELRPGPLAAAVRTEIDKSGIPLGVAVPRRDTTYPVGNTADLARARTAYTLLHDYGRALPFVAAVLLLLGLALSRWRAHARFVSGRPAGRPRVSADESSTRARRRRQMWRRDWTIRNRLAT